MTSNKIHLAKYLKDCGNYTKSEIKQLIENKQVLVNGVLQPLSYVVNHDDIITVNGNVLKQVPLVYYIYNKPIGIICTNNKNISDSIVNYLDLPQRVFCVGRLDKDSRGLMLLTNDGLLANRLLSPTSHVEKEYIVKVKYSIDDNFIEKISKPIILRGKKTLPVDAKLIDEYTFSIILHEGKYRQIRRLVISCQNTVVDLLRVRFGNLLLNDLEEGKIKTITQEEII